MDEVFKAIYAVNPKKHDYALIWTGSAAGFKRFKKAIAKLKQPKRETS